MFAVQLKVAGFLFGTKKWHLLVILITNIYYRCEMVILFHILNEVIDRSPSFNFFQRTLSCSREGRNIKYIKKLYYALSLCLIMKPLHLHTNICSNIYTRYESHYIIFIPFSMISTQLCKNYKYEKWCWTHLIYANPTMHHHLQIRRSFGSELQRTSLHWS